MVLQLMATHFNKTDDGDTIDSDTNYFIFFIFIYVVNTLLSPSLVCLLNSVMVVESNSYLYALFLNTK